MGCMTLSLMVNLSPGKFWKQRIHADLNKETFQKWGENSTDDESWKDEYQSWKFLKPYQIKLLREGAKNQSQAWLLNQMWCEWKEIKCNNPPSDTHIKLNTAIREWEQSFSEEENPSC